MSRTSQIRENPCKVFATWKSVYTTKVIEGEEFRKLKGGTFVYWDKVKGENVEIELPFKFAIINPGLVTFKGFNEKLKSGVWSNEVSDPEHEVSIRNKNGILMTFKLKDYKEQNIKDKVAGCCAKYTRSVYIGVPTKAGIEIYNLQISGAAASGGSDKDDTNPEDKNDGWFAFSRLNKANLYKRWIVVKDVKNKKKGPNPFTVPVFELGDVISDKDGDVLDALDIELKDFLAYYFDKPATPTATASKEAVEDEESEEEEEDYNYDN